MPFEPHTALKLHQQNDVLEYLKNGGDPELLGEMNQTLLHVACFEGLKKIVNALLSKKVNVNALDNKLWTALHCAASSSHYEICETLINYKQQNVNIFAKTADSNNVLHYLVKGKSNPQGQVKCMVLVISKGLSVNDVNVHGETPLMRASLVGSPESIQYLLSQGADVNIQNVYVPFSSFSTYIFIIITTVNYYPYHYNYHYHLNTYFM